MSETFSKLFSSITDSSVWSESHEVVRVWITMLAMADQHGYVAAAVPGLANRARVEVHECEEALAKFLAPDPYSRSKDHEGRRVEVADRGWVLLNYPRFRDMRDEEVRKTYERDRKRKQRADAKARTQDGGGGPADGRMVFSVPDSLDLSPIVPPRLPVSAQAEADQDADPEAEPEAEPEQPPPPSGPAIRSVGPFPRELEPVDVVQREIRSNHVSVNRTGGLEMSCIPADAAQVPPDADRYPSSGALAEIDMVRRLVESETGETVGGMTHRLDKMDGLAPAIADKGLARVLEVVKFRCEQVARRVVKPALWRRLFSGDGFYAALEQLELHERTIRNVRKALADDPEGTPEDQDRGIALLESHKLGGK